MYVYIHLLYDLVPCFVGPCHHGMARLRVADGGDGLQIWRVAAMRTANKGLSSNLRVGQEANNSSPCKEQLGTKCYTGPWRNWRFFSTVINI
jgi:hypothetical protein